MQINGGSSLYGLGKFTAIIGIIAAVGIASLNLLVSHVLLETIPLAIGLACIIYILIADDPDTQVWQRRFTAESDSIRLSPELGRLLPILINFGIGLLVVIAALMNGRGIAFYIVASLTMTLFLAHLIFAHENELWPALALFQILVFAFVLRFSALVMTPSWIGIDIWVHMEVYARTILETGSLETGMDESKYLVAPLYHLAIVATTLLTGLSLRAGLYLSIGFAMPISIALVYLAANTYTDTRWALFATALYSVCDFVILWGLHLIPTSLGVVFFLTFATILLQVFENDEPVHIVSASLIIFLLIAITFTHQVSAFITMVFLVCACAVQFLLSSGILNWIRRRFGMSESRSDDVTDVYGYAVFSVGLLVFNWSLTPWQGQTFLETGLGIVWASLSNSDIADRTATTAAAPPEPEGIAILIPYIDYIGFVFVLFVTIIAGLYVIDRQDTDQLPLTLLVAGTIMAFFTLVPPLFGIRDLLPARWFAFMFFPMALLTATGFSVMESRMRTTTFVVVVVVFILIVPSSMILTTDATPERPVFEDQEPRFAYTHTELSGMSTVEEIIDDDQPVNVDHPFVSDGNAYTDSSQYTGATVTADLDEPATVSDDEEWHAYREYQSTGAPYFEHPDAPGTHIRQIDRNAVCIDSDHIAYSNGDVELCGAPSG